MRARSFLREVGQRHLAVAYLHDEDAGLALPALLARRPVLLELDRPVDAGDAHAPERVADRFGIVFPRQPDRLGDRRDPVVAAEALGEAVEGIAAFVPLV